MKKVEISSLTKKQLIKKSSSTLMLAVAIAAFIVSFSLVTLNFLWGLSGHNNRVISGKSEASKILSTNVENISDLQSSFNVFEAGDVQSDTVLDALPSKYDYPALATSMESLVQKSGLELESFSGDDLEDGAVQSSTSPTPVPIEFRLAVTGSYSDMQKFVTSLERTIRPMKIVSMEFKGTDDSALKASFNVVTYYQPATSLEVETRTVE